MGGDADSYKLADGCGLSNYNYISPDLLVSFLKFAYSRTDVFQKLYKALPIGGVDGTLKYRMQPLIRMYMPKPGPLQLLIAWPAICVPQTGMKWLLPS